MSKAFLLNVINQVVCKLAIIIVIAIPAICLNFVDAYRTIVSISLCAMFKPFAIVPLKFGINNNRPSIRWKLMRALHRICLHNPASSLSHNLKLINFACTYSWNEKLPNTARSKRTHCVAATIPIVKVANNSYSACVWRPHRKSSSSNFFNHLACFWANKTPRIGNAFNMSA
ncbi:Uncharacterised protein [Chlamydia trachomatis]|nr:Uncharacterised protein [Chlamydia trachomatis]